MENGPQFLVIGAAKSGTTSLYHWLREHPEIFVPRLKEPHFFSHGRGISRYSGPGDAVLTRNSVRTLAAYGKLFSSRENGKIAGEMSTGYLFGEAAPRLIREHLPSAKLVAILRHPVDRAYSQYRMMRRFRHEPTADFLTAWRDDERRRAAGWYVCCYKSKSLYFKQLARYHALFPATQIRVYLFDDLVNDPAALLRDLFTYLDVEPSFVPDLTRRYNEGGELAYPPCGSLGAGHERSGPGSCPSFRWRSAADSFKSFDDVLSRLTAPRNYLPTFARRSLSRCGTTLHRLQDLIDRDLGQWFNDTSIAQAA